MGDICESIFDGPHATPKKTESGPVYLGISNLIGGRLNLTNTEHLSEEDYVTWTRRVEPRANDIVFSYETRLGEAAIIPEGLRCCLGRRLALLRADLKKVDPKFLLYSYLGPEFQEVIRSRTIHGSTVDRIPLIQFGRFPVRIPPIDEQKAIAKILSSLDDKIELNRRMNATLEAMARALFKAWFVDFEPVHANIERRPSTSASPEIAKLFPSHFENGIPKGWEEQPFSNFVDLFNERVAATPTKDEERYIALDDMPSKSIDLSKHRRGAEVNSSIIRFEQNDILFGSMRPYFHKVGIAPFTGITRTTTFVLRPKAPFWKCFALFHLFSDEVVEFSTINSVGSTIPYVKWETLGNYKVPFPPADILERFDATVWKLVERIFVNGRESSLLAKIRDSVLPRLISGRLRLGRAVESTSI